MSMLSLVLLLIVILGKKIKNPEMIRTLKLALGIGIVYWAVILSAVSVFKLPPSSLPMNPLIAELALKGFTTYLFYRTLNLAAKSSERKWLLWLLGIGIIDLVMVLGSLFLDG